MQPSRDSPVPASETDEPKYWTALFSGQTWQEFISAGADTAGYREARWKTVQSIQPGDRLLCYMTGVSRWVGLLEVTSAPYWSNEPIWSDETFPCRVPVKALIVLKPEFGIPVKDMKDRLSIFQNLKSPGAWSWHFYTAPRRLRPDDAEVVTEVLRAAQKDPVVRPVDPAKLDRKPGS